MIDTAEKIGKDIDFARVDLYSTTKGIVLGEITIYPEGGMENSPTACPMFNRWLGIQWEMGRKDSIMVGVLHYAYLIAKRIKQKYNLRY